MIKAEQCQSLLFIITLWKIMHTPFQTKCAKPHDHKQWLKVSWLRMSRHNVSQILSWNPHLRKLLAVPGVPLSYHDSWTQGVPKQKAQKYPLLLVHKILKEGGRRLYYWDWRSGALPWVPLNLRQRPSLPQPQSPQGPDNSDSLSRTCINIRITRSG